MTLGQMIEEYAVDYDGDPVTINQDVRGIVSIVQSWLETPEVAEAIYGALTGTGDGPPLHAIVHALQRAAEKGLT